MLSRGRKTVHDRIFNWVRGCGSQLERRRTGGLSDKPKSRLSAVKTIGAAELGTASRVEVASVGALRK